MFESTSKLKSMPRTRFARVAVLAFVRGLAHSLFALCVFSPCLSSAASTIASPWGRTATGRLEFDHIIPRAAGGPTTLENMAAVCRKHNRQKGTMSLAEYRDYLELRRFFDSEGPKYLDHVIAATTWYV